MVSFVKIIFIGLLITIMQSANSQTYNYVTYTSREGLAGNMVYDMIQDETGFIWFGTDNGLSRFDGKNFKNYTVNDGLMDNEVLFFHKDFSGRLWMATFSHDLSYRKGNRFYTKYNDTMIARIKPEGRVVSFREGPDSTLWIFCQAQVFCWPKGGVLHEKKFKPAIQQRILNGITHPVIQWIGNYPCISFNDSLFYIQDDSLVFISGFKYQTGVKEITYKGKSGEPQKYSFPNDIVRVTTRNGLPHFVSTVKGAFEMNYNEYNPTPVEHFLPDKGVTSAFMDLEGNYWFSTLGDGVYKLVTKSALTYSISKDINALNEVFSIGKRNDSILTGHGGSRLAIWKSGKLQQVITYEKFLPYFENSIATNRLKSILPLENGAWLLGFDGFLLWQRGKEQKFLPMKAIKTMELQKDHTVLIASGQDVIKVDLDNFKIIKTYYNQRATCATAWNGKVFIGTLSGLKVVDGDNVLPYNAEDSILSRRIIGLASNDRFMWVATSDAGLVQISSNGKRTLLNERNGLPSDICRTMVLSGNNLWVGTNKGLAHIRLTDPKREVLVYNQFNLLPNNAISSLFADNNEVMVGSPAGFTVFETGKVNTNSICGLELDKIQSSKKSWQEDEVILLTPTDNFLQIDYSGISARAAGQMDYFFMLEGMDNQWQQTKVNVITYSNLPPGNYIFKIFARNIFGVSSEVRFFKVSVTAPFWKKRWFLVVCFLSGLGIIFLIFYFRLQVRNKKIEENNRIQLQL
ncbi:MAG: hypothetical protein MUE99_07100, partial [Chitinophagaceae bacterium]|nr:hypothetical protein [Chitinophagaceae bacterium]